MTYGAEAMELTKQDVLRKLRAEGITIDDEARAIACLTRCALPRILKEAYYILVKERETKQF